MRYFKNSGLQHYQPGSRTDLAQWAFYHSNWGCIVNSVYLDPQGHVRVDATTIRQGVKFRYVYTQTPAPKVGDRGFISFLDQRRDSPFYVGIIQDFGPMQVTVTAVDTVNGVVALDYGQGRTVANVPYVVTGVVPKAGDIGLAYSMNGQSSLPVYIGPLSKV